MADFTVLPQGSRPPSSAVSCAFLIADAWDDWFTYSTMYTLIVFDNEGQRRDIGSVKIGQFGMQEGQRRPDLPHVFEHLDERFFSLGQDDTYYSELIEAGSNIRSEVLARLKDIALDLNLFSLAFRERVTQESLMRFVSKPTVIGQFHRMALGGARLTPYNFMYTAPLRSEAVDAISLQFDVTPESYPPTNIHVLIGRNGVGKTTILHLMARQILIPHDDSGDNGQFLTIDGQAAEDIFSNVVSVTFSAFDPFEPSVLKEVNSKGVRYSYIGLKQFSTGDDGSPLPPKTPDALSSEFSDSVAVCTQGARFDRWRRALEMLEADPIFKDAHVAELAHDDVFNDLKERAIYLFGNLSSGHKIVLLTVTRLVETVEEKTIVLIDEPEAHLHPPLLSAFVRALSDLLIDRNGVAIVATHSPVVLQEVPRSCSWKIRRSGTLSVAERPDIQTFGENVGVLTREVFGLEVTRSGFHKMLGDAVSELNDYESVVERFNGELGDEARAIVQGLIAARDSDRE